MTTATFLSLIVGVLSQGSFVVRSLACSRAEIIIAWLQNWTSHLPSSSSSLGFLFMLYCFAYATGAAAANDADV
jgi:hypothetical protein